MGTIACIVEGHGEVAAVPELIRRVARERCGAYAVTVRRPIRLPKGSLLRYVVQQQDSRFERDMNLAARSVGRSGAVLIMVDADDGCPAEIGPRILSWAQTVRPDVRSGVVIAAREYENWFIAAAPSLELTSQTPKDPESIRGAKEWVERHRGRYTPTADQVSMTSRMDLDQAAGCRSFRKCLKEVERLIRFACQSRPIITLIAAVGRNGVIGRDNDLPWRLPDDMKHFMRTTRGHAVVMGRKTYESMDGPLKGRRNIIITRQDGYVREGAEVVGGLDEAIKLAGDVDEVFIAGGEQIYRLALPVAHRMLLTEVDGEFDGDVRFPEFDSKDWREISREHHEADDRHSHAFDIVCHQRIGEPAEQP